MDICLFVFCGAIYFRLSFINKLVRYICVCVLFLGGGIESEAHTAYLPVVDNNACRQSYMSSMNLTHRICAGYDLRGIGICKVISKSN